MKIQVGPKAAEDKCQGRDWIPQRRRSTFLVWAHMLLCPGFIPPNAKHQKSAQKEKHLPKAQLRCGLGVSQYLSWEEAMVIRYFS